MRARRSSPTEPPALPRPAAESEHLRVGDEYYVLASSLASRRHKHILGHGDMFAVLDQSGDVPLAVEEELGLFFRGTRYLSQLELLVYGRPPFFLSASMDRDDLRAVANLTNNDVLNDGEPTPRSTVSIRRTTLIAAPVMLVRLVLHSFHPKPLLVELELRCWADFTDVFELRGMHRARAGTHEPPRADDRGLVFSYRGLDGVHRSTRCEITGTDAIWQGSRATLALALAPEEERVVDVAFTCCTSEVPTCIRHGFAEAEATRVAEHGEWRSEAAVLQPAHDEASAVVTQAMADVFMLTAPPEPGTPHAVDRYIYAGIPWFATIFGRDGLIAARELLLVAPGLARGVLAVLAALQGTRVDRERDEAPGKILHEARYGEMAALGEVPFGRYYGSVDATPLFCMLLADYARATGDLGFVRQMWPHALAAVAWMDEFGDADRDGYLEYQRGGAHGLVNQGWKDSGDAVFHRDGTLAEPPIALVEVQGYRYAALRGMADVADMIGVAGAPRWREAAARLRENINRDFWLEGEDTYVLALDRDKRRCEVVTSNAGHLLYCGVPDAERAPRLATRLFRPDVFAGWGIRTLASGQPRYNPMSYHNGSVWPHDNALIAAGLRRYGRVDAVLCLLGGLVEAAVHFEDRRLPELFCGFSRRGEAAPVPYPVACRPQAWAAGSIFLLLEAALGVEVDALRRRIVFREPQLPTWLPSLEIRNLRVGAARLDLLVLRGRYGGSIEIMRKDGEVEVVETR